MIRAIISGACGAMGRNVAECIANDSEIEVVAGVDKFNSGAQFPIFSTFSAVNVTADVIIDFSNVSVLDDLLDFAVKTGTPAVIATTGYSDEQIEKIKEFSKKTAIFFTFNFSLGVNLICSLAKKAAAILDGFDIEIIEKHHNQKLDAPSGTAIMLANSINETYENKLSYEYDRHSKRAKRSKNEIGIHSIRGGTIVGEHDVLFAGNDETITISHAATSKKVFASGAIAAAKFIVNKQNGLYDMNNIIDFD